MSLICKNIYNIIYFYSFKPNENILRDYRINCDEIQLWMGLTSEVGFLSYPILSAFVV